MHIEQRDLTHVYMKCIHQDAFYMNNSLIHVAISIKLHSPGIVGTSGNGSVVNQLFKGYKLRCHSHKYRTQK